jgi:hypothetical protein
MSAMSLLSLCLSAVEKNGVQGYVRFKKEQQLFKKINLGFRTVLAIRIVSFFEKIAIGFSYGLSAKMRRAKSKWDYRMPSLKMCF